MEKIHSVINHKLAQDAESLGYLPDEWLKLIYEEKWFKLFVPSYLDGLGLTLPEGLELEEELARQDASLAWTVTLCAGAAWFVGFLDWHLGKEIFTDPKACLAGSGFVGGTANLENGSYEINGNWTYASGALHATHLTANCRIFEDGTPTKDHNGKDVIKAFILKREEVTILDGWSYMGMVATGSHAFSATKLKVYADRSFEISPEKAVLPDPIFQYPFQQLAETTLAANVLGVTLHFMDLVDECFTARNVKRNYDDIHLDYYNELKSNCTQYILNQRYAFYEAVEKSWIELTQRGMISEDTLNLVSKTSRKLAITCRESAAKLHPFAGLEAAKKHTEINRVWRDMNTISQHALLIFPF